MGDFIGKSKAMTAIIRSGSRLVKAPALKPLERLPSQYYDSIKATSTTSRNTM